MPTSQRPDLIIFDLDGTLADTLADIAAAMNRALRRRGLPAIAADDYRQYVGEGVRRLVEQALPHRPDLWDPLTREFRADYSDHLLVDTAPYPGIPELLRELTQREVPLAVLSNKPHPMTGRVVDALFPETDFVAVVGHRQDVPRKPDPTSALAIARDAGADPTRCVFVGDTQVDVQTARAADMVPIGVSWGFRPRADLAEHGARCVLERPSELLEHVGIA